MRSPLSTTLVAAALLSTAISGSGCRRSTRAEAPITAEPSSLRSTTHGDVIGLSEGGAHAWLGIPYAAPPVGPLRWRAPRPAEAWTGTREAVRFGAFCPQFTNMTLPDHRALPKPLVGSEDCLTLNVYAPPFERDAVPQGEARRPVMFWIHGGGNTMGAAATYHGAKNLAERHGVVVVTLNYRLGLLGWFSHPSLHEASGDEVTDALDRSGNYGTLDLIAALQWVRDNASAFGGDPRNVTIFGESAGGMNVFSLLVSSQAQGLFHKAIVQSGLPWSSTMAQARHFTDDAEAPGDAASSGEILLSLLQKEGLAKGRDAAKAKLAAMSPEEVRSFLRSRTPEQLLAHFGEAPGLGMYRSPYILRDGHVIPDLPILEALAGRAAAEGNAPVPVVLGTNRDEYKLFMARDPRFTRSVFGIPRIRDEARYERVASALSRGWRVIGVELPAERLDAPVFAYRFDWDDAPDKGVVDLGKLLGAAHGMEIPLVFLEFGTDLFPVVSKENLGGRREVGEAMASYWTNFAWTGTPGRGRDGSLPEWGAWSDGTIVFDRSAEGGVRMEQARETLEAVIADLLPAQGVQPASTASTVSAREHEDRCVTAAGLFEFLLSTGSWTAEDFATITEGRCAQWPLPALQKKAR